MTTNLPQPYIALQFASPQEALYRIAAVALHTYRFGKGGSYIRLLTKEQLADVPQMAIYEKMVEIIYGVPISRQGCKSIPPQSTGQRNDSTLSIIKSEINNRMALFVFPEVKYNIMFKIV